MNAGPFVVAGAAAAAAVLFVPTSLQPSGAPVNVFLDLTQGRDAADLATDLMYGLVVGILVFVVMLFLLGGF